MNWIIVLGVILTVSVFMFVLVSFWRARKRSLRLRAGLSNRLRTMLPFAARNDKIEVHWPITKACNGHFLDAFEPLPNVKFVTQLQGFPYTFWGQKMFNKMAMNEGVAKEDLPEFAVECYSKLKLLPHLQEKVDNFVYKHGIDKGASIHVRRTDFITPWKKGEPDTHWFEFIESFPPTTPIFLATDNRETQDTYTSKYPNVVVYKFLDKNNKSQRKSSFVDAVIDMYIASRASKFLGTYQSSYSETIGFLRKVNQKQT